MSSIATKLLWEDFFRDPSQFCDNRNLKRNPKAPDFIHKKTRNPLWIDRRHNPPWVRARLKELDLARNPHFQGRSALLDLIKLCGEEKDLCKARMIHADILCKESQGSLIIADDYVGSALFSAYAKCGALREARLVLEQIQVRDLVSWNALIAGYVRLGYAHDALKCFQDMEYHEIIPNAITYTCVLKACGIVGSLETGRKIDLQVRKEGLLDNDMVLGSALVDMYAKCGAIEKAQETFRQLRVRDVVSWTALIDANVRHGLGHEGLECFRNMQREGIMPNYVTYVCTLKACALIGSLEMGEEIHDEICRRGLLKKNSIVLGNALIDMYAKLGALEKARAICDHLEGRDVVSWTILIDGYVQNGLANEALECFQNMEDEGVLPSAVSYICILKACSILGSLEIGQDIDTQIRKLGLFQKDPGLANTLLHMYAKCGALKKAHELFVEIPFRDVVSWSALMAGYAQFGQAKIVMELTEKMRLEGILPDAVTFLVLLNACSHSGLIDEGEKLVVEMCMVYHLLPSVEHYACMIDLFGRAGYFDRVQSFASLKFTSDNLRLLLAILGACQKWVNISLGRWAFEKSIELDENCGSAYICMENIYAAAGILKEREV